MLQTIRDRASGWIAYAVILLISIPFALWGVNHYLEGGGKEVAADVGGTPISIQTFARAYQEQQMRLQQMFGGEMPSGLDAQTVKEMVLRDLIRDAVFHQAAVGAGYQTTSKEVIDQLLRYPVFQVDGKFSKDRYVQVLRAQGMTPEQFEERLRRALSIEQFQQGILQTAFMPSYQARQVLRLRNEKRDIVLSIIPASQFVDTVKIDEKQVNAYYDKHKADYMTPEKVRLAYLRLDAADLKVADNVSEADLHQYYQEHRAQFETPERAKISEIVVNLDGDSAGAQESADARLRAVVAGLKKGETFSSLAKKYSQAPSAKDGGSVGDVTRSDLPPALANAVFALKPGEVTPPLKVQNKVYRLKLDVLYPAQKPSFDEVLEQVKTAYVNAQTEHRFDTLAQRLTTLTYQSPGTLEPAAKALGLTVMKTDWLTHSGGAGIGENSKVLAAAFSNAVLHNGSNSQPIEIGKHDVVVIRVLERKAPEQESLDTVHAQIRGVLVKQAAENEAERTGKSLISAVKSGKKTLAEAAKGDVSKVSVRELGWIGRNDGQDVPVSVLKAAFQLSAAGKEPAVSGLQLSNGDYGVFVVKGIKFPVPDTAAVKDAQTQLGGRLGQMELQVVYQALERADNVKVYPSNLNF